MVALSSAERRLLQVFAALAFLGLAWVGWQLYLVDGAAQLIVWQTDDGGLTLLYHPLKNHKTIFAGDAYVSGSRRVWRMTDPGGSQRLVGAPEVPSPESLFAEAWIADVDPSPDSDCGPHPQHGLSCSTGAGLTALYADASESQRSNIDGMLQSACEVNPSYCAFASQVRDQPHEP